MSEKIVEYNIVKQSNTDMRAYAVYVARSRMIPSFQDGLKPVQRRIMYALFHDFPQTRNGKTVKTASVGGRVVERYHPHGDASVYATIKPMVNWFESYMPLIKQQGSFGNIWGDAASAPRYTEVALTPYGVECVIGDMNETDASTDWELNYDGNYKEPIYLPSKVPNLLINGTFGIAVGLKTEIPKHNINEVIDATINLIDNPNYDVVLVPDDPQGSDIIEADWASMSHTGKGKFKTRAKIEIGEFNNRPALFVNSLPSMVFFETVREKIEKLKESNVLPQVVDILNNSKLPNFKSNATEKFQAIISLKRGSDPVYVRDVLYASTALEKTTSVNFEVIYKQNPVSWSYKKYLQEFIKFRKERKARLFNNKLKECNTRIHELDLYIKVMKSGKIEDIVRAIRKQNSSNDDELINFIIKTLSKAKVMITPLQAKFLLNTNIKKLSLGYLKQYEDETNSLLKIANYCEDMCIHVEKLDGIIKQELLDIKAKYGCPRRSRIISANAVDNIPDGIFKVIFTSNGFIKKVDPNDRSSLRNDKAICTIVADNKDNLLVFGKRGKVYKLPVYKIPFASNSNGTDLRIVMKKYSGEGVSIVLSEASLIELENSFKNENAECDIFILTREGLFKRIPIEELNNISVSGLIYTKLNESDEVVDIIGMEPNNEMLIYSRNKILRVLGTEAPFLNRMSKGNIAMSSKYAMGGMICVVPNSTCAVVITESGRVNKVPLSIIPLSTRAKAGTSVIKLGKTDNIKYVFACKENDVLNVTTNSKKIEIKVSDLKNSSSLSTGDKLIDSSGILSVRHDSYR